MYALIWNSELDNYKSLLTFKAFKAMRERKGGLKMGGSVVHMK